jgi:hypothetical protein
LDPFSEASLFPANETMNYVAGTSLLLWQETPFLLSFSAVINWNNFTLPEEEQSFQATTNGRRIFPSRLPPKLARSPFQCNGVSCSYDTHTETAAQESALKIRLDGRTRIQLRRKAGPTNFGVLLTAHLSITQSMYQLGAPIPLLFI